VTFFEPDKINNPGIDPEQQSLEQTFGLKDYEALKPPLKIFCTPAISVILKGCGAGLEGGCSLGPVPCNGLVTITELQQPTDISQDTSRCETIRHKSMSL